ncbi:MAG: DUF5127 domain-containing protein, partial [Bacteroidetes bacterium]|nr:DUF5127 domain-containing protein [Bacteroidota bacterium]
MKLLLQRNRALLGAGMMSIALLSARAQVTQMPAYPLITHNTYFSIWSNTDKLNESVTHHWTGKNQSLLGIIKVDGQFYRFMGESAPSYKTVLNAGDEAEYACKYVAETKPDSGWMMPSFNDESWKSGMGPFGDNRAKAGVEWTGQDIWIRRRFNINAVPEGRLMLKIFHDDGAEVFLNGKLINRARGANGDHEMFTLNDEAKSKLKTGENLLAIHCKNTGGGSWIDVGLSEEVASHEQDGISKAEQTSVNVTATQTTYGFACGPVKLRVCFSSPLLMTNLDLFSSPVSYISYKVSSTDGKAHKVDIWQGVSSNLAVNQPSQPVQASMYSSNGLSILKTGTAEQPVLQKKGDNLRIDWGYAYVAVPAGVSTHQYITADGEAIGSFLHGAYSKTTDAGKELMLNTVLSFAAVNATA